MRLIKATAETMRKKARGAASVNVAQGIDGTAVLCFETRNGKGNPVAYFEKWESQTALRDKLAAWPDLAGVPLFVDMVKVGTLPEAAEKVGAPIATA